MLATTSNSQVANGNAATFDFTADENYRGHNGTNVSPLTSPTSTCLFRPSVVLTLLGVGALALPLDVPLAKFFMSDPLPGELRSLIHKAEVFGHAYGIMAIVFTIYLICEHRRRQLPRLLATALCAGLACDVVKALVHRVRPVDFSFAADDATFRGLSFLHVESWSQIFDSQYHSFPSAHTGTAVAFAIGLGAIFPRAASWFLTLAAICALSRFDGGAHYVSDTFVGAAIGYATAVWMLGDNVVGNWFTRREAIANVAHQNAMLSVAPR